MYPVLFTVFGFEISTFGVMLVVGFLVAGWLYARAFAELGYDPEDAKDLLVWSGVGGILGSKLWFVAESVVRTGVPLTSVLFSRGGLTWYGGLVLGTAAVVIAARRKRVPLRVATQFAAPCVAVGQFFGRIGCFLVGDDYGGPTDLPWGVAFPDGIDPISTPVHPTMLYEAAWLLAITGLLWLRRTRSPFLFGEYLMLASLGRFFVEELRLNPAFIAGLTNAQVTAVVLALIGATGWLLLSRRWTPLPRAAAS